MNETLYTTTDMQICITRIVNAPRQLVWKAFTDPEILSKWWGPDCFTNSVCEVDLRIGGAWRIIMVGPDGIDYPCNGVYQEIDEPTRLVFTLTATDAQDNPVLDGVTTVTLAERDGKTALTLDARAVGLVPYAAAYLQGMEPGWTQSLNRLAATLVTVQ